MDSVVSMRRTSSAFARVRKLSDEALFNVIHEGIPQAGMPGFSDMGKEDDRRGHCLFAFLARQVPADARVTGRTQSEAGNLFFGKAGCSACHRSRARQFIAEDLTGFARDHEVGEIREAILKPAGGPPEAATAVARDGRKFSGMIRNEDNASLQLQDGDGRFYLLMKSSLVSVQRKTGDPMPVDYGQRLSSTRTG